MDDELAALRRRWDEAAPAEEAWARRPSLNRALRWREIERRLAGARTVLDVGGGTGAFSVPLAQRGLEVVHFDLSPAMIERARANGAGCATLSFALGDAADLSRFETGRFDLVLAMDGAISSSGRRAEQVIAECARVTARVLIASCAHRAFTAAAEARGEPPAELRSFLPAELAHLLARAGLRVARSGGVGTLGLLCGEAEVAAQLADPARRDRFLDACERFDREIAPDGPGSLDDTGLLAVALRG